MTYHTCFDPRCPKNSQNRLPKCTKNANNASLDLKVFFLALAAEGVTHEIFIRYVCSVDTSFRSPPGDCIGPHQHIKTTPAFTRCLQARDVPTLARHCASTRGPSYARNQFRCVVLSATCRKLCCKVQHHFGYLEETGWHRSVQRTSKCFWWILVQSYPISI